MFFPMIFPSSVSYEPSMIFRLREYAGHDESKVAFYCLETKQNFSSTDCIAQKVQKAGDSVMIRGCLSARWIKLQFIEDTMKHF